MRIRFLLTLGLVAGFAQVSVADVIFIDDFSKINPGGGDGIVGSTLGDETDRTFASDGSIMTTGAGLLAPIQDRELQATNFPLGAATIIASGEIDTSAVGSGLDASYLGELEGNVHSTTAIALAYDGSVVGDTFGLNNHGATFDLLTKTGGNEQHSIIVYGTDGAGDNVTFQIEVESAAGNATVSDLTFNDEGGADGRRFVHFDSFDGVNFATVTGVQVTFVGTNAVAGNAFTVYSIYAHNPEPASLALFGGLGVVGLLIARRRK